MTEYLAIYEHADNWERARARLPGYVSTGNSRHDVKTEIGGAAALHVERRRAERLPGSDPTFAGTPHVPSPDLASSNSGPVTGRRRSRDGFQAHRIGTEPWRAATHPTSSR